ncbi:MAG: 16S rRNA (cytosine(967)-C(5))-methyltransferase RsmB [Lachnospiraceae bacterium]|nr:16S rRNA (cytosine(967)-C(5))-methyltransferase RsmB [Lachnospiraceae bacterium]
MAEGLKGTKLNSRELIMEMLLEITSGREYSHIVIRNVLDKYDYLKTEEKAFMKRVCEGTLERMIQIDYVLNQFSNTKVNKMKPVIRTILRMSVYQILYMDAVPDSAACNEAVKLAERKKFHQLKGFVNGVLRNIARQKEQITYPAKAREIVPYLSVTYSMPEWIVEKWLQEYDGDTVEKILQGLLKEHGMSIRMDETLSVEEKQQLLEQMKQQGIQVEQHPYLPYAYTLKKVEGVSHLPGFGEGKLTIQDISSMLVCEVAGIQREDKILDVCAAPGGKSIHAACKLRGTGMVYARDLTDYKVALIQQNIDRMAYENIRAEVADALVHQTEYDNYADILYADLPCSGLGVMGKKRDIKYRVTPESLQDITKLQQSILHMVQNYVKPGGTLIYSTCTINRAENEKMVEWFTAQYPFHLESLDPFLTKEIQSETTAKGYLQLLPGVHETDGFFLARLKRNVE